MSSHSIVRKEKPENADIVAIASHLQRFNVASGPPVEHHVVVLQVLDEEGRVQGGLFGQIAYQWLHIEYLVVSEESRAQGIGRSLMAQAEAIASERKCTGIWLNTLAFQARGFYEKLGYERFATLADFPSGGSLYFLMKRIHPSSPGL